MLLVVIPTIFIGYYYNIHAKYILDAHVDVCSSGEDFKGLFFCTEDMKRNFAAYSEILFLDGTYKLLAMLLTVMIFLSEDADGHSEIVGVGLIQSEDHDTFTWLLETFRKHNEEACKKLQCVMTDKDLLEREVLKQVFLNVPTYICRFHSLKTFNRVISNMKDLSPEEKLEALEILQNMTYSESEEKFQELYTKLKDTMPICVVTYFDDNWYEIRDEWTAYSMHCGNLGNMTNNRLESINKQIKSVVEKRSSLLEFLKHFFQWLRSHNFETDCKISKLFLKKPILSDNTGACEQKYIVYLTAFGYSLIKQNFETFKFIDLVETNVKDQSCIINSGSRKLKVTPNSCECHDFKTLTLPCRHIFKVRNHFEMALFNENLCNPRFTKSYVKTNNRVFVEEQGKLVGTESDKAPPTVTMFKTSKQKVKTVPEKRKQITPLLNSIAEIVSTSCGESFDEMTEFLTTVRKAWLEGSRIESIKLKKKNEDIIEITSGVQQLSIETANNTSLDVGSTEEDISRIEMPAAMKIRGRPSKFLQTTVTYKKKRQLKH